MLTLLHLLSAVALLVWGTHIVRTGVMRVFGARLRTVLSRSVEKKPLAFCAGIGVTALVQSSNATTMLVTSFVAQDLVALAPALVIVLGADVGTALMARILTFDLSWLSPLLIFIGVIFFLGRKQSRAGQLGRVGIGLGLILLALELIVQAVTPITQANGVQVIFASLTGDILLDALIGAMFAIISYSSLAAVLLTATLTAAGIISFPVALCLVIGANLGSGLLVNGYVTDWLVKGGMAPIKSRKICIIAGMFCSAAFTLIVPQATTSMTAVLLIGMALFCIHFAGTSCWGLIHVAVASRMTASVGSIQNFASFICASFAPIITGFIVDTTHSFRLALIICGCVTAAGALAYIFLVRQPINDPRKD